MTKRTLSNLLVAGIVAIACSSALAATQFSQIISTNISPKMVASFTTGGRAHGSGGIIMQGETTFVMGKLDGTPVSPNSIRLSLTDNAQMCLSYKNNCFRVALNRDLVKPLIRWILHGSETAFSNTEGRRGPSRKMEADGLVHRTFEQHGRRYGGHYIAPQFNNERIFDLLRAADYSQNGLVEALPSRLEREIIDNYYRAASKAEKGNSIVHSTWTNADYNTVYTTVLSEGMAITHGLPLRYFWTQYSGEDALQITRIRIFKDPTEDQDEVLEDIVRMYQAAAILRALANFDQAQLAAILRP
jgi:hypothetical protein